jgi:hypothetical protein
MNPFKTLSHILKEAAAAAQHVISISQLRGK